MSSTGRVTFGRKVESIGAIADRILADGISAQEVLALRSAIYGRDGTIDRAEAETLFRINEASRHGANSVEWYELFVEALTDYFVWRQEPAGYISDEDVSFLIKMIDRDGHFDGRTEFALVVNILWRLLDAPPALVELALRGIRETVLSSDHALYGIGERTPGVIDSLDVELMRRVIFGAAGCGRITVSRAEADLVFDINDASQEADNDPAWQEFFVTVISHHVLHPEGTAPLIDRDEAMRRDAWMTERRGAGDTLRQAARSVGDGSFLGNIKSLFGDVMPEPPPLADDLDAVGGRSEVNDEEAQWLSTRITNDLRHHRSEKALLERISAEVHVNHPLLRSLMTEMGL